MRRRKHKSRSITQHDPGKQLDADAVCITEAFNGVGFPSEEGLYSVCHRGFGIEIVLDGKLVWSSGDLKHDRRTLWPTPTKKK